MNKKYIIFGAGNFGKEALRVLGKQNVAAFLDSNEEKIGKEYLGKKIISFNDFLRIQKDYTTVIAVDLDKTSELSTQLKNNGITDYTFYHTLSNGNLQAAFNGKKQLDINVIEEKCWKWIKQYTVPEKGIADTSQFQRPYPEVTGYYIPTLLSYGKINLAKQYATWLLQSQLECGAWSGVTVDFAGDITTPYLFDTMQILKGLTAIVPYMPEQAEFLKHSIKKASDWILKYIGSNGEISYPESYTFGDESCISSLIHIYGVSPLYKVTELLDDKKYAVAAEKAKKYFINEKKDNIMNFSFLSHFYAYVMEALCDLKEYKLANMAMAQIAELQTENGAIPAFKNVNFVCSTGLFQLALVWYKLGNRALADKAFEYACGLQNESGGWYGSYAVVNNPLPDDGLNYPSYLPTNEISWANKYFLDALKYYRTIK